MFNFRLWCNSPPKLVQYVTKKHLIQVLIYDGLTKNVSSCYFLYRLRCIYLPLLRNEDRSQGQCRCSHGRRNGRHWWSAPPLEFKNWHFPNKCLVMKSSFLSFEWAKWNFTIFDNLWKIFFCYLRKVPLFAPPWKKIPTPMAAADLHFKNMERWWRPIHPQRLVHTFPMTRLNAKY